MQHKLFKIMRLIYYTNILCARYLPTINLIHEFTITNLYHFGHLI